MGWQDGLTLTPWALQGASIAPSGESVPTLGITVAANHGEGAFLEEVPLGKGDCTGAHLATKPLCWVPSYTLIIKPCLKWGNGSER